MKKGIIICITTCMAALALTFLVLVAGNKWAVREVTGLKAEDVAAVTAWAVPPDKEAVLGEEEINELVEILSTVAVYCKDNSYNEYSGQWVEFRITKADGSQLEVAAYAPFIIINGEGYQAKYEPCQKLNGLGNRVIEAASVNPEQDKLNILVGDDSIFNSRTMAMANEKGLYALLPEEEETLQALIQSGDWKKGTVDSETVAAGGAVCDFVEMIKVKDQVYISTNTVVDVLRCGVMDGEIDSTVGKGEYPEENNQSNFGTGFGYQIISEDVVDVYINGEWIMFTPVDREIYIDRNWRMQEEDKEIEEEASLMTITSNKQTSDAYEIFSASMTWSEHGWLCVCGLDPATSLPEVADKLPEFTLADDFGVDLKENVVLQEIVIYDKNFQELQRGADLDIQELKYGRYYIGYEILEQGAYIAGEGKHETSEYSCMFGLIVSAVDEKVG